MYHNTTPFPLFARRIYQTGLSSTNLTLEIQPCKRKGNKYRYIRFQLIKEYNSEVSLTLLIEAVNASTRERDIEDVHIVKFPLEEVRIRHEIVTNPDVAVEV